MSNNSPVLVAVGQQVYRDKESKFHNDDLPILRV